MIFWSWLPQDSVCAFAPCSFGVVLKYKPHFWQKTLFSSKERPWLWNEKRWAYTENWQKRCFAKNLCTNKPQFVILQETIEKLLAAQLITPGTFYHQFNAGLSHCLIRLFVIKNKISFWNPVPTAWQWGLNTILNLETLGPVSWRSGKFLGLTRVDWVDTDPGKKHHKWIMVSWHKPLSGGQFLTIFVQASHQKFTSNSDNIESTQTQ